MLSYREADILDRLKQKQVGVLTFSRTKTLDSPVNSITYRYVFSSTKNVSIKKLLPSLYMNATINKSTNELMCWDWTDLVKILWSEGITPGNVTGNRDFSQLYVEVL